MPIGDHEHLIKESNHMIKDMQPNYTQMIQNMEANQINLQNRINGMEAQEMNVMENRLKIMEVNHSNQMSIIQNHMIAMEARHTQEMTIIQNWLGKMERSHIQNVQPKSKLSTDHRPPSLL